MITIDKPLALGPVTRNYAWVVARRLSKAAPYRGYALDLGNGQMLACNPDGQYEIKARPQEPNLQPNLIRGQQEINGFTLPSHGDVVKDVDGKCWIIRMDGGFKLRNGSECHPDFLNGPKDAMELCVWFNVI